MDKSQVEIRGHYIWKTGSGDFTVTVDSHFTQGGYFNITILAAPEGLDHLVNGKRILSAADLSPLPKREE